MSKVSKVFAWIFLILFLSSVFSVVTIIYSGAISDLNKFATLHSGEIFNFTSPITGRLYIDTHNTFEIVGETFRFEYTLYDEDGLVIAHESFEESNPGLEVETDYYTYEVNYTVEYGLNYGLLIECQSNNEADLYYAHNNFERFALKYGNLSEEKLKSASIFDWMFILNLLFGLPWLIVSICCFRRSKTK